jgi:hypothetical protein
MKMKAFKIIFLIPLLLLGLSSCNDFLEEEYLSGIDTETFYSTESGMESLIAACYATSKIWFAKEEGYDFSVPGTDIYDYGQQHPQQYQYTFTSDFNSSNSRLVVLWIELYKGINACNDAISILSDPGATPLDAALSKKRLAEVRFLRALYNWLVVETWGGVEFRTEPIKGVVKEAYRTPVEVFYNGIEGEDNGILKDLNFAVDNLSDADNMSDPEYGRVNRLAARGFRARMRLTWASYTNDQTLYAGAAEDAIAVINSGNFQLYDDYADVWDIANNSSNTENVWAINYSQTQFAAIGVPATEYTPYQRSGDKPWDDREGGHHGHLMFGSQYDIYSGMIRDIENGRPFRRYSPTQYLIDAFNEDVDERFYGSFKTTWFANRDATTMQRFLTTEKKLDKNNADDDTTITMVTATTLSGLSLYLDSGMVITHVNSSPNDTILTPDSKYLEIFNKKVSGKLMFEQGDTCIHYTKDQIPDDIQLIDIRSNYMWNLERGYWCMDYDNMFYEDGTLNDDEAFQRNIFFELHKFYDNMRLAATDAGSQRGLRDAYVMRISEMYLIAAEALMKTGQAASAYSDYLIPLANKRSYDGDGAAMLASYGINSGSDLDMDFILDERARELCGEQLRWFDLKRLGTEAMVARIRQYAGNLDARNNFDAHFTVRPIPQVELDAITNKEDFPQNDDY